MSEDFPEIYLQADADADYAGEGRQWCQDDVWSGEPENSAPTKYIRADLHDAVAVDLEEAQDALKTANDAHDQALIKLDAAQDRVTELEAENARLRRQVAALESLRPHWAEGHSSDSAAAQTKTSALAQVWSLLGVENQTDAMIALRSLAASAPNPAATGEGDLMFLGWGLFSGRRNLYTTFRTKQEAKESAARGPGKIDVLPVYAGAPAAPTGDAVREWPIEARRLLDAGQQVVIAFGMGWDIDLVIAGLRDQCDAAEKLGVSPSQDHYPAALSQEPRS